MKLPCIRGDAPSASECLHHDRRREAERDDTRAAQMALARASRATGRGLFMLLPLRFRASRCCTSRPATGRSTVTLAPIGNGRIATGVCV